MSHFNISPLVMQQLQLAHELNLVMFDVIKFLALACAAMIEPLSPHAKPRVWKQHLEIKSKKEDSYACEQPNNDNST